MVARIDDKSIQGIGGVHLGHGSVKGGESGNVETSEEDLTMRSQEERGESGRWGGWTGGCIWVRRRPMAAKRACFLVEERVRRWADALKEKGLAILPPLESNPKSELQQRAGI